MKSISQVSCNGKTERKKETPIWKGIRENHKAPSHRSILDSKSKIWIDGGRHGRNNAKGASGPQPALS